MGSPHGIGALASRPVLVALALGAATLGLIIRGATNRRRLERVALLSQSPGHAATMVTLKDVYRRGDITHQDHVELWWRIREG